MSNILDVCSSINIGNQNIDFIGKKNLWIDNSYEKSVYELAKYIILEAVQNTALGQLSIIGYDKDLSGILAPFSSLSAGESKILDIVTTKEQFEQKLNFLVSEIQSVQNVIQGRKESLLEFRENIGRPVESYKLVVISMDIGLIDSDLRNKIALLMRNGPNNGISFLIISTSMITIETSSGKDVVLPIDSIAPNITVIDTLNNELSIDGQYYGSSIPSISSEVIISKCENIINNFASSVLPTVRFDEIVDVNSLWTYNSTDGLVFSIGQYGLSNMNITIGDEVNQRHNAIITGAVGQGKSNLISVIIHSLCQRYSPEELELYLLDFKEGVTFKPFSNIGQDEYLPHAKALGLESDVSFGEAVLSFLYSKYKERMKLLKDNNLKSIQEYRKKFPDKRMPRILVIIDEFQMMFGDDQSQGQNIADQLEKSVRLFRAAGIHFILASQTLEGNMALASKKDSIFSQVPIRIALKNTITESHNTLGLTNSAAAFLKPREAIVNLDYGEISQNRKILVAFADENILLKLRYIWWKQCNRVSSPPYVFISEKRVTINNQVNHIRNSSSVDNKCPRALLGEKISIKGDLLEIPVPNESGRNIAIIGTPDRVCNNAEGMLESIAISLAAQDNICNSRFIYCDFSVDGNEYNTKYAKFISLMNSLNHNVEFINPDQFENTIDDLLLVKPDKDMTVYLFGSYMDKWACETNINGTKLKQFVENGSLNGLHFFGWWLKSSKFTSHVAGFGNSDAFNTKVFLRTDERTVQSLTSPFVKWKSQENRALVYDSIEYSEEIAFVPYSPI